MQYLQCTYQDDIGHSVHDLLADVIAIHIWAPACVSKDEVSMQWEKQKDVRMQKEHSNTVNQWLPIKQAQAKTAPTCIPRSACH